MLIALTPSATDSHAANANPWRFQDPTLGQTCRSKATSTELDNTPSEHSVPKTEENRSEHSIGAKLGGRGGGEPKLATRPIREISVDATQVLLGN